MSTYYEFYVGKKIDEKYEAVGTYVRRGEEYRLIPLLDRSRSFISWNDFGAWPLPVEKSLYSSCGSAESDVVRAGNNRYNEKRC